jgi:hypothetical protein
MIKSPSERIREILLRTNMKKTFVTIVSGLPRSGTSMMMRAIEAGGMQALIDHIRQADENNPKGYYEFEPVKKTKEDASWLRLAEGKVVKMVYRLLYDLPANYEYRVVFMQRKMQEVLASQKKMLQQSGKKTDSIPDEQMEALFRAEVDKCQRWLAGQPNFKVLYVDYMDMINDPKTQARRVDDFLGGGLNVEAIAASVDPSLYRNRSQSVQ